MQRDLSGTRKYRKFLHFRSSRFCGAVVFCGLEVHLMPKEFNAERNGARSDRPVFNFFSSAIMQCWPNGESIWHWFLKYHRDHVSHTRRFPLKHSKNWFSSALHTMNHRRNEKSILKSQTAGKRSSMSRVETFFVYEANRAWNWTNIESRIVNISIAPSVNICECCDAVDVQEHLESSLGVKRCTQYSLALLLQFPDSWGILLLLHRCHFQSHINICTIHLRSVLVLVY